MCHSGKMYRILGEIAFELFSAVHHAHAGSNIQPEGPVSVEIPKVSHETTPGGPPTTQAKKKKKGKEKFCTQMHYR